MYPVVTVPPVNSAIYLSVHSQETFGTGRTSNEGCAVGSITWCYRFCYSCFEAPVATGAFAAHLGRSLKILSMFQQLCCRFFFSNEAWFNDLWSIERSQFGRRFAALPSIRQARLADPTRWCIKLDAPTEPALGHGLGSGAGLGYH